MSLLGVGDDPSYATFAGRMHHRDDIERLMADWCAARTSQEVLDAFTAAHAAVGLVMDMADIAADHHFRDRRTIAPVPDGDRGAATPMQSLIARLSSTPGAVRWAGRPLDADGKAIREQGWNAFDGS
jgi:crotonobetainyl-CoA:carnitine CoA-transferase CaiB-like acyl-CoA transferase